VRILLSLATAISILAVALLLVMTPVWMHFAVGATSTANFVSPQQAFELSDRTVAELFLGPGTFAPFASDEAAHMRDVRVVLYGFLLLSAACLVFVAASLLRAPRGVSRWKAVSRGGIWLIVAMVVLGVFALTAFEAAFTLFHEIFFPGGNWAFSADSLLIRLYPEQFWELSAAALGILASLGALIVWITARRRAAALTTAAVAKA
jgi:integral membrane protein (TIGR01906 family)